MSTSAASRDLPTIYVNFVFATDHEQAKALDRRAQAVKEVEILNRYFVTEEQKKIFNFKLKKYLSFKEFSQKHCELATALNQPSMIKGKKISQLFNQCFPAEPNTVYIFVYDAYNQKKGWADITSWGMRNNAHPYVLIDWERLNYKTQAALPHEMGHAFGLKHVCAPNARLNDATNIMASADCGLGSGGQRNQGFNKEQLATILKNY